MNANGGTINSGNVTSYKQGVGATLPTNVTKSGYTFGGWYTNSSFSGSAVTRISTTDTGNKTYYAKWDQSAYHIDIVNKGEYIKMVPTSTYYSISASMTGYSSSQTINPSELELWRVISKNSDGSIDAISDYASSIKVYFRGTIGYANFVDTLQTIASKYANTSYTKTTRMVGYDGQTLKISNTTAFDGTSTSTPSTSNTPLPVSGTGQEYTAYSPGDIGDTLYLKDYILINEVYGRYFAYDVSTKTKTNYWLASRGYSTGVGGTGRYLSFELHYVMGTVNSVVGYQIRHYANNNGWSDKEYACGVRPIVTFKSGLTISGGSGTKEDPYTLS